MNAQNAKDFLPLVQALAEGKTIQCKTLCKSSSGVTDDGWFDVVGDHYFDNPNYFYRIKPEPRRWWIIKWSEHKHDIAFCERGAQAMAAQFPDSYCEIIPVEERM